MNLPCILQNYADEFIGELKDKPAEVRESVETEKNEDFDIKTLNDKDKYDFIVENFHKFDLAKLEQII